MFHEDTTAKQRIAMNLVERRDELEKVTRSKSEQEFLRKFRDEAVDHLHLFIEHIMAAPLQVKQKLISGSIEGKITIKSLSDGGFEISIPWKLSLPLLQEILNEVTPPDDGPQGGNNPEYRNNGHYRCSSLNRDRYALGDQGGPRPHSSWPLRES